MSIYASPSRVLFRTNIEPSCVYCIHSVRLNDDCMGCLKRGVVSVTDMCNKFAYDPLKRIPARPLRLQSGKFSDEDFAL